jgi:amylosucrase
LHGTNGTLASLAGLEAADTPQDREMALRRIALLNGLAVAAGGLATTYMGDEAGMLNDRTYLADPDKAHEGRWLHRPMMRWDELETDDAQRITQDLAHLRDARLAADGAGAPEPIGAEDPRLLGIRCGTDAVFLNFSPDDVTLPLGGIDRLTGVACDRVGPWQIGWLAAEEV